MLDDHSRLDFECLARNTFVACVITSTKVADWFTQRMGVASQALRFCSSDREADFRGSLSVATASCSEFHSLLLAPLLPVHIGLGRSRRSCSHSAGRIVWPSRSLTAGQHTTMSCLSVVELTREYSKHDFAHPVCPTEDFERLHQQVAESRSAISTIDLNFVANRKVSGRTSRERAHAPIHYRHLAIVMHSIFHIEAERAEASYCF